MKAEVWRPIETHRDYEVSDQGKIRRSMFLWLASLGRILRPRVRKGRYRVSLSPDYRDYPIAHLVLTAFVGPRPSSAHESNHKDGNTTNNSMANLEWVTQQENIEHAIRNQLRPDCRGEKNGRAKLSTPDVLAIRQSDEAQALIAAQYGVSKSLIGAIKRNECWPVREDES